jgi:hypothetical protein
MFCHGETHNAETEKSDFSHVLKPWGFAGAIEFAGPYAGEGAVKLVQSSKQVPPRMWNTHNKPCAMKGNASVWRVGMVLC